MTAASFDRMFRRLRQRRGAALVVVVVSMSVLLGSAGLALDLGRGYMAKLRMGRAADAAVLAAGRALRQGVDEAIHEAEAIARANGIEDGVDGVVTSMDFGANEFGERTVQFTVSRSISTTFMKILGFEQMAIRATGVAAVPPADIVLVLDTSGSLASAGAWDDLQQAAKTFVQYFDDEIDQMGLVSFQLGGFTLFNLAGNFKVPIKQWIDDAASAGDTNIGEGFARAREQILGPSARARAAKVVVFFTDGRATAFRRVMGTPAQDRILAVYANSNTIRGSFSDPNSLPKFTSATPSTCKDVSSCYGFNGNDVRQESAAAGLAEAAQIRQAGVLIYVIGLGNPAMTDPLMVPDLNYLKMLANENGIVSPTQPQGKMFFAPSAAQLQQVFEEVAKDLIVRLAA